jgi:hypothetical protein
MRRTSIHSMRRLRDRCKLVTQAAGGLFMAFALGSLLSEEAGGSRETSGAIAVALLAACIAALIGWLVTASMLRRHRASSKGPLQRALGFELDKYSREPTGRSRRSERI